MKKKLLLFALSALSFTPIKSQCSFGSYPPSYTLNPGWTNGAWLAQKFTLSSSATLTGLGLNSAANSQIPFRMAIYTDASNTPGNLVATANQGTIVLGQNILSIPVSTIIPAGSYWIAAIYGGSGPATTNLSGTTPIHFLSGNLSNAPANNSTWSVGSNYDIDYWAVINTPDIIVTGSSVTCLGGSIPLTVAGALSYSWSTGANTNSILISPSVNTTYSVVGANALGCINYAVQQVTVLPTPTLVISGSNSVCAGSLLSLTVSGANTYSWSNGSITNTLQSSPLSNLTYSVMGMAGNGCVSFANHSILVSPLPSLTITGTNNLCSGSSLSQTVSGATTYSWSTGATGNTVQLSPINTTVYSVTGTDANNCFSTLSNTVVVNPLPVITSTLSNPVLCNGQTGTIAIGGVTTCTWNTGSTSTLLVNTPTLTTNYIVTGTDLNGCTSSVSISQVVNECTGIKTEKSLTPLVKLFPNPNAGVFTVNLDAFETNTKIEIYNISGKLVKFENVVNVDTHFDFSTYAKGMYYLVISNNSGKTTLKMLKE